MATLSNEADSVDPGRGAVTLMTLHASKGLEFPVVYVIGVESGLIPHERAVRDGDPASFEEERRLLFVGITRAMQELTLTQTSERTFRGMRRATISSPFIPELHGAISRESLVATPPQIAERCSISILKKLDADLPQHRLSTAEDSSLRHPNWLQRMSNARWLMQ